MKRLLILALAVTAVSASAQVAFNGSLYTQDFDTLANTGAANPWADNTQPGLTGWYTTATTYEADDGSSFTSPMMKSYGENASGLNPSERALGSMVIFPGTFSSGVRLNNTSGLTLGSITLTYTGEQWLGGATSNTDLISFDYNGSATGLGGGGWTAVGALNFVSPDTTTLGALGPPTFIAPPSATLSTTITGLSWANGADMWLRWTHSGFGRHGMAIDDVLITANPVPEPFTMALAAAGLGLAARRRLSTRRAS